MISSRRAQWQPDRVPGPKAEKRPKSRSRGRGSGSAQLIGGVELSPSFPLEGFQLGSNPPGAPLHNRLIDGDRDKR